MKGDDYRGAPLPTGPRVALAGLGGLAILTLPVLWLSVLELLTNHIEWPHRGEFLALAATTSCVAAGFGTIPGLLVGLLDLTYGRSILLGSLWGTASAVPALVLDGPDWFVPLAVGLASLGALAALSACCLLGWATRRQNRLSLDGESIVIGPKPGVKAARPGPGHPGEHECWWPTGVKLED